MFDFVRCIVSKLRTEGRRLKPAQRVHALLLPLLLMSYAYQLPKAEPPRASQNVPLSLRMEMNNPFSPQPKWTLTVDKVGAARLTIETTSSKTRTFQVSDKQMAAFRKAVAKEQFFALRKEYGVGIPDGGWRTLSVTEGEQSKMVTLRFFNDNDANLLEAQRALRLWYAARSLFTDAQVLDTRKYDQHILDAKPATTQK